MQDLNSGQVISFTAFTTKYGSLSRKLINDVTLCNGSKQLSVKAQWDTGATNSCISEEVVNNLSLDAVGVTQVHTPSSTSIRSTYLLDIVLPNSVEIKDVRVNDSEIGKQGIGILIGMDIMLLGDFAVSNYEGKTTFSFRVPSLEETDYRTRKPIMKFDKIYPNDPCPCGSEKKYKQCCGAVKKL
jgi:hypothetical protein